MIAIDRAWDENNISNPLFVVEDGVECLDYLKGRGAYSDRSKFQRPGVLILDINIPRMDGLTVLEHVREDPEFRRLPVVVLTTTKEEAEGLKSYDLGANAFVTKPIEFEDLSHAIKTINMF